MNLERIIELLAQTIYMRPEFTALKKAKAAVTLNPDATKLLADFERKRGAAYSPNTPENTRRQLMNELDSGFVILNKTPELKNYFSAADDFNTFMGGTIDGLMSRVNKNL